MRRTHFENVTRASHSSTWCRAIVRVAKVTLFGKPVMIVTCCNWTWPGACCLWGKAELFDNYSGRLHCLRIAKLDGNNMLRLVEHRLRNWHYTRRRNLAPTNLIFYISRVSVLSRNRLVQRGHLIQKLATANMKRAPFFCGRDRP